MTELQGIPSRPRQDEDFAALFEESLKREDIKEGEIVRGRVIQITKDHVVVDIGYKSEGQVAIAEFTAPDGQVTMGEAPVDYGYATLIVRRATLTSGRYQVQATAGTGAGHATLQLP